jgi:hypothetical protein
MEEKEVLPYIPNGAKINDGREELPPPNTMYEDRKAIISRDEIKKQITKREIP